MTALTLVPTTDTMTGWLILAVIALAFITACTGAVEVWRHLHPRRRPAQLRFHIHADSSQFEEAMRGIQAATEEAHRRIRAAREAEDIENNRRASEVHE